MPKAENRKRPPNFLGTVPGSAKNNKYTGVAHNPYHQSVKNKKQELLEKMREHQQSMKVAEGKPE